MTGRAVFLVPYDPRWPALFEHERDLIGAARGYARLKHELAERFRDGREAYTAAETAFISAVVGRARIQAVRVRRRPLV